jgi:SAM-dependent methyltransferase
MKSATRPQGTAQRWGALWGARPRGWSEIEEQQLPTYEEAIRRVGISPGDAVLDLGCGSGVFLRAAADRGASVSGLDAAESLLEVAQARVPEAELTQGDLERLPYDDDRFDLVTGFNSFFFAADMTAALREAGRVAKPGATVLIQVWGRPERCDLTAMLGAISELRPQRAANGAPPLWKPGVLERIAEQAGLSPRTAFDFSYAIEYPDEEVLAERMLSAGGIVEAVRDSGEDEVRHAIVRSLAPYRLADGSYRLENEWHYLVTIARRTPR